MLHSAPQIVTLVTVSYLVTRVQTTEPEEHVNRGKPTVVQYASIPSFFFNLGRFFGQVGNMYRQSFKMTVGVRSTVVFQPQIVKKLGAISPRWNFFGITVGPLSRSIFYGQLKKCFRGVN